MIGIQKKLIAHTSLNILVVMIAFFALQTFLCSLTWSLTLKIISYLVTAILLGLFSYWYILATTRSVSDSVKGVAEDIQALSRGDEDIHFKQSNTLEIQEIVKAAEILQFEIMNGEKERRQWTQDITHDLRTPITAIKSQLQAVRDGVFSMDEERYTLLFRELGIIEKMVQDFALLGRIESPEMKMHQKWVLSQRLMESLVQRFDMQTRDRNIRLIPEAGYFYFKTDDNLFLRAASNLIQNAMQYTHADSEILLKLVINQNQILFSVENPGMIPEEDLPFIFQRLYRGEKSRTTTGSGLGLTIAKSIAQLQKGDIQARNTDHGSTVFEMTINMVF